MTQDKLFEEQFPSLKDIPVTLISGPLADATLLRIGNKEWKYEVSKQQMSDYDFAIPLSAIQTYCLDKQKVREAIFSIIKKFPDEDNNEISLYLLDKLGLQ